MRLREILASIAPPQRHIRAKARLELCDPDDFHRLFDALCSEHFTGRFRQGGNATENRRWFDFEIEEDAVFALLKYDGEMWLLP